MKKNILVPIDFSEASVVAAKFAIELASAQGASTLLLHVVPSKSQLNCSLAKMECFVNNLQAPCESAISVGETSQEIVCAANQHSTLCVVMPDHPKRGMLGRVRTSIPSVIQRRVTCPVVTVSSSIAELVTQED